MYGRPKVYVANETVQRYLYYKLYCLQVLLSSNCPLLICLLWFDGWLKVCFAGSTFYSNSLNIDSLAEYSTILLSQLCHFCFMLYPRSYVFYSHDYSTVSAFVWLVYVKVVPYSVWFP